MKPFSQILDAVLRDVACGKHSGFPPCCVAFYVSFWRWLDHAAPKTYRRIMGYHQVVDVTAGFPVPYVACPLCVIRGSFRREYVSCLCSRLRAKPATCSYSHEVLS